MKRYFISLGVLSRRAIVVTVSKIFLIEIASVDCECIVLNLNSFYVVTFWSHQ